MRWLRKFLTSWYLRIPSVQSLIKRANRAVEEAGLIKAASRMDDLMGQEVEMQYSRLRERMEDILDLRRAQVACYNPKAFQSMRESHAGPVQSTAQFKERLWELELALEDRGWVREVTLANLEFSRLGVQQLIRICRIYAIKNPWIKRGAEICALYVFARGIEIRSEDNTANEVIQDFLESNKKELGHISLAAKELSIQTDGSLYFALPVKPDGTVSVTMIDPLEIMDVITDPDDTSSPRFFYREWARLDTEENQSPQNLKVWYPALNYEPDTKPKEIKGTAVNWDMPVMRVKIGCPPSWRWGVPPLYASIDWARAYKDFLEDWATVQRTLSRFALMVDTKGGAPAIAAYNALLNTTFADSSGTQIERNPPPNVASAHISGPGNTIEAFKSAGAKDSPEQARRLLLGVAAAQGMPETFYGDASTGSLATAQSLDRPTELKFLEMQNRWTDTLNQMLSFALRVAGGTAKNKMRESLKGAKLHIIPMRPRVKINGIVWEAGKITKEGDVNIVIRFPAVLEHDPSVMVDAWAHVGTLGGRTGIPAGVVDRRTIAAGMLHEIGYEATDELLEAIYGQLSTDEVEGDYDPGDDVSDQRTQVPAELLKVATGPDLIALGLSPKLGKGFLSIPKPKDVLKPPAPPAPAPPEPAPPAPAPPKPNGKVKNN